MNREIYTFMESNSYWLSWWILGFTLINLIKICQRFLKKEEAGSQNTFYVEAAGIPLVLLHSVCFVKSLSSLDFVSILLFAWWGPGFLIIATLYIQKMREGAHLKWGKTRNLIAWICKVNYLIFAVIYWKLGCYGMLFVFSIWIINDQVMMAWLSDDADRFRRTFHDFWVIRLLYPVGLSLPLFFPESFMYAQIWAAYGSGLFLIWLVGITRLYRQKKFMQLPKDQGLLRNMTYFKDEEAHSDQRI